MNIKLSFMLIITVLKLFFSPKSTQPSIPLGKVS